MAQSRLVLPLPHPSLLLAVLARVAAVNLALAAAAAAVCLPAAAAGVEAVEAVEAVVGVGVAEGQQWTLPPLAARKLSQVLLPAT